MSAPPHLICIDLVRAELRNSRKGLLSTCALKRVLFAWSSMRWFWRCFKISYSIFVEPEAGLKQSTRAKRTKNGPNEECFNNLIDT